MRKNILFLFVLISTLSVLSVERVSLDTLRANWTKYSGHTVVITTPLVVCGNFYDSLILAPSRLFCPEERAEGLAEGDSTAYYAIVENNKSESIVLHCRNAYYEVRTGDIVHPLKARVTKERHLLTGRSIRTRHKHSDRLSRAGKEAIRVVGANIENYFADLGGYAHKKTTPSQQTLKTRKLIKGMRMMHADVFALCEMQVGDKAPQMLLSELNKRKEKYAYVTLPLSNADRIGGCFIYYKDRVRAYGVPLSAYQDSTNHYYGRMFAQGFEQLDREGNPTGKKFIVSINHFKSKRPGRTNYDTNVKRLSNADSLLASIPVMIRRFADADILLLGDFNCYTQEAPIQKIIRAGYKDELPHGTSDNYSYTFKGESGYLDRCFASPSMAEQILKVRPWHVNADWYYSHGAYKMSDKTHHRYSDHDPIIVDIRLK